MGMESLSEERSAVMLTWATERAGEMAEAVRAARAQGYDPGDVEAFERSKPDGSTLRWRLAYRHFTRLQQGAGSGIVPFLIELGERLACGGSAGRDRAGWASGGGEGPRRCGAKPAMLGHCTCRLAAAARRGGSALRDA